MKEGIIGFVIGAVGGSLITYFVVKEKFEEKNQKEQAEIREYYRKKPEAKKIKPAPVEEKTDSEPVVRFAGVTRAQNEMKEKILEERYNYADISKNEEEGGGEAVVKPNKALIYEISEDQYGENDDYDAIIITWYPKQEILADDQDYKMSLEDIGGEDMLARFDGDEKFVRNDVKQIDYDICLDDKNTWTDPEA